MTINSIIISCTIFLFEGIFTKIIESQLILFFSLLGCFFFFFLTQWVIKIEIKVFSCLRWIDNKICCLLKKVSNWIILGCHGSSDLTTILLEVPFKTHQGQVRYLWDMLTDHKKKQLPQKRFWIFLSTWGSILW